MSAHKYPSLEAAKLMSVPHPEQWQPQGERKWVQGGREAGARRGRGRAWDGVRNRVVVLLPFPCTASSLALFPSLAVPLLNSFRYSRSPSYHLCTVSAFFCFPTCTATRQPHRSKKSASCFLSRCRGGNCIVDDEHSRQVSFFAGL